jgi:hypothetical protein
MSRDDAEDALYLLVPVGRLPVVLAIGGHRTGSLAVVDRRPVLAALG